MGGSPGFSSALSINGSLYKFAIITGAPKTGSIRKVHWRTTNITTAGADPLDIRIETVDAAGLPSGTLWGTNTNIPYTLGAANSWQVSDALTADAVITDTDVLIAIVISNPVANFSNFQMASIVSAMAGSAGRPYQAMFTTGWAVQNVVPVFALEYSDGSIEYIPGAWPIEEFTSATVSNATTPDEIGFRFQVPFRARARGFWMVKRCSSNADLDIVLYDAAGTQALVKSFDADLFRAPMSSEILEEHFDGTLILEPGTVYRLAYKSTTAVTGEVFYMNVNSAALMNAMPGGADAYWTERSAAGTWTDITTRWPLMGVHLDQLSDDIGAGGSDIFIPRVAVV